MQDCSDVGHAVSERATGGGNPQLRCIRHVKSPVGRRREGFMDGEYQETANLWHSARWEGEAPAEPQASGDVE